MTRSQFSSPWWVQRPIIPVKTFLNARRNRFPIVLSIDCFMYYKRIETVLESPRCMRSLKLKSKCTFSRTVIRRNSNFTKSVCHFLFGQTSWNDITGTRYKNFVFSRCYSVLTISDFGGFFFSDARNVTRFEKGIVLKDPLISIRINRLPKRSRQRFLLFKYKS